jgi:hypothetical protein
MKIKRNVRLRRKRKLQRRQIKQLENRLKRILKQQIDIEKRIQKILIRE